MSEASFGEIFATYYQSPTPARAVATLEVEAPRDSGLLNKRWRTLEIYFFSTIAREYPPIVSEYEALFDRQPSRLVLDVLAQAGDAGTLRFIDARLGDERFRALHHQMRELVKGWPTKRIDPLATPARTALDLDLLWAEFLVTGRTTSVERIIDVLEWPDLLRQRVEFSLRLPGLVRSIGGSLPWLGRSRLSLSTGVVRRLGIEVDRQRRVVETPEDLDTRFLTADGSFDGEAWSLISPSLSKKERENVATKAAARWSLGANAIEHPRVVETCEAGSATRGGRARLALLEIVANARLSRGDLVQASAWARRYLELSPGDSDMNGLLDRATEVPPASTLDDVTDVDGTSAAEGPSGHTGPGDDAQKPDQPIKRGLVGGAIAWGLFLVAFLVSWSIWFAVAMGALTPANYIFPGGHRYGSWVALFVGGWIASAVVPLAAIITSEDPEDMILAVFFLALPLFPGIVAFIEVGALRLLGWM
jgi:hypothetical protein